MLKFSLKTFSMNSKWRQFSNSDCAARTLEISLIFRFSVRFLLSALKHTGNARRETFASAAFWSLIYHAKWIDEHEANVWMLSKGEHFDSLTFILCSRRACCVQSFVDSFHYSAKFCQWRSLPSRAKHPGGICGSRANFSHYFVVWFEALATCNIINFLLAPIRNLHLHEIWMPSTLKPFSFGKVVIVFGRFMTWLLTQAAWNALSWKFNACHGDEICWCDS